MFVKYYFSHMNFTLSTSDKIVFNVLVKNCSTTIAEA